MNTLLIICLLLLLIVVIFLLTRQDREKKNMSSINIIDFCKKNKIKMLPVKLKIVDNSKKYLKGKEGKFKDGRHNFRINDFKRYTLNECNNFMRLYLQETDYIGIDTSNINQLDIDDKNWLNNTELVEKWENVPHFKSISKSLPHYLFLPKIYYSKNRYASESIPYKHDILNGLWSFVHKNTIVFNNEVIPTIELIPDIFITQRDDENYFN